MSKRKVMTGCLLMLGWSLCCAQAAPPVSVPVSGQPVSALADPAAPIIFIGTAFGERLAELKDRRQWATVAARAGMFVHPNNINKKSTQLAIMSEVAPLFGLRQAVIERNALPKADDVVMRLTLMRETYKFTDGLYFYFNGITPGKMVNKKFVVVQPDPAWYDRARLVTESGGIPLFGPAPHNLCRTPDGWADSGWDFLRDLTVFKGYCFDAPAELYIKTGKTPVQQAQCERYRTAVAESILHARQQGGKTIYLLCTHGTAAENIDNGRQVVRDLKKRKALPWAWGIEDYSRNSAIHMGPERNPDGTPANTVTGMALWIYEFYAGRVQ